MFGATFLIFFLGLATGAINNTGSLDQRRASIDDLNRLRDLIVDAIDHRFRPVQNQLEDIKVTVSFHLLHILQLDEVQMQLKISCAFQFAWQDELRSWKTDNFSGINKIHLDPTDVWRPRLFIFNSVDDRDVFKDEYAHLAVSSDGSTNWQPGAILTTSCDLDLRRYPYDNQVCYILMKSSFFAKEITFLTPKEKAVTENFTQNGEWILVNTSLTRMDVHEPFGTFSVLKISIYLERNPEFFLLNSILPIVMISFLLLLVFLLPKESGERAGYSMTVLLALSLSHTSMTSQLPKTPHSFPYVVMYLFGLLILSWLMVVSTIFVLLWHHAKSRQHQENTRTSVELPGSRTKNFKGDQDKFICLETDSISDNRADTDALTDALAMHLDTNGEHGGSKTRHVDFITSLRKRSIHPADLKGSEASGHGGPFLKNSTDISHVRFLNCFVSMDIDIILFSLFLISWLLLSTLFFMFMIVF